MRFFFYFIICVARSQIAFICPHLSDFIRNSVAHASAKITMNKRFFTFQKKKNNNKCFDLLTNICTHSGGSFYDIYQLRSCELYGH